MHVALSVYLDGLGGGTGTHQDVTFSLYQEDPNTGNPGTRSIVTETISIPQACGRNGSQCLFRRTRCTRPAVS